MLSQAQLGAYGLTGSGSAITRFGDLRDEARAQGKWRDVVAYGLDELEDWLAQAPVTRAWFADQLGLHPGGYRSAREWWRDWASATSPALPPDLLIAGRDEQAHELLQRLDGEPVVTTVRAESTDEVAAFVVAAALSENDSAEGLLARTAVVDDIDSWRAMLGWRSPLVLVSTRRELVNELRVGSGHHVVVPALGAQGDLCLPRIDSREAQQALEGAGMKAAEAEETGRLARRCLMAARIRLARSRELLLPGWAKAPAPRPVRAVLLAGFWSHAADDDREVLAALAGEDYETLNERLEQMGHDRCPLAMRADRAWHLVSVVDTWELLRSHITVDDLERLKSAVQQVLGERDESLESPDERWMGSVFGRARPYSSELRRAWPGRWRFLPFIARTYRAPVAPTGLDGPRRSCGNFCLRQILPRTSMRGSRSETFYPRWQRQHPQCSLTRLNRPCRPLTPTVHLLLSRCTRPSCGAWRGSRGARITSLAPPMRLPLSMRDLQARMPKPRRCRSLWGCSFRGDPSPACRRKRDYRYSTACALVTPTAHGS